jgi:PIN domain nuclease of toxin-antitoxin system
VRLLLDTHVVLWWSERNRLLKPALRKQIVEADAVFVSAASAWEVSIKVALGKLTVPGPLMDVVTASGFAPLPIEFAHAEAVKNLPLLHTDPFDRLLVAQAQVEKLHLVTNDRMLERYPVQFLRA